VWKVEDSGRTICVKRALLRLRVAKLWEAPVARSEAEWNWLNFARSVVPNAVPRALAHDAEAGMIAIEYLEPAQYPVWKQQLFDGIVDPNVAATVARVIARIHAASAGNPDIAAQFKTRESFYALRIEPYLLEAARRNPMVAEPLNHLAEQTLQTEIALVHGDLSPKNILVGHEGPVILDAETAWYGDPAFDLAFCLNHLLLKCVARPQLAEGYFSCFESFQPAYLAGVAWEEAAGIESRAVRLLPALLLARVDGKSPVEYLMPAQQSFVRNCAIELIRQSPVQLDTIARIWRDELTRFPSRSEHPRAG
jgi:aminoglycoside phosphotransferase (APT) family kinase protein